MMTFDRIERSNYEGLPISLYEFSYDNVVIWRYCSAETDIVLDGHTYTAMAISDGGIIMSGDVKNDDLTISLPPDAQLAMLYRGTPPSGSMLVSIRRKHRSASNAPIVWAGSITAVKQVSPSQVDVVCKMLTSTFSRGGLRIAWGRGCPHSLYDINCTVDPEDHAVTFQVVSKSGASITAPILDTLDDGWFAGGFLKVALDYGIVDKRGIETHVGSTISLLGATDGIEVGDWVTAYPGCDLVRVTCNTKFNNLSNFGGFPHMPGKSPFDGNPVF